MRKRYPAIGCLLAAGLLAMGGCARKEQGGAAVMPPVVHGVTVEEVGTSVIPDVQEAVGTVRARAAAQIAARLAGTVSAVHVKEGDRVPRGKLLVSLEAAESTAGAAGAAAGAEEAKRALDEARARQKLADATFERYRKLYQEQAVTRQEFDGKETEKAVAAEGVARAEARLIQARETSRAAGTVAGYTRVTAPIAGIVTGKTVDAGMTVFPGTPLMTVEEEGSYRLEVAAPEALLGGVKGGAPLQVSVDGGGEMTGRVAEVVPTVDPASRTFTVKVDIAARGLRSGMYGRAYFPVGERSVLLVPKGAVVERGALTSVWVVGPGNMARMRLVKVGRAAGDRVEILAGLSAGEQVVAAGVEKVVDGAKIEQIPNSNAKNPNNQKKTK
jgi:RND family efflux transporter MFP subunit